jgi:hypothetical protein
MKDGSHVDAYAILIKLLAREIAAKELGGDVLQRFVGYMIRPVQIVGRLGRGGGLCPFVSIDP